MSRKKRASLVPLLLLHRCTTDGCILPPFPEPLHGGGEPNRLGPGLAWTSDFSSPPPLSFPRVSNETSSRDFEGVARLAADQPINKITRLRFYRVDASSLLPSSSCSISLSRIYTFGAGVHILAVRQFLRVTNVLRIKLS